MKLRIRCRALLAAVVLSLAVVGASCGGRLPNRLPMDLNPVFTGGIGWIVVSEAYARVKAAASSEALDIGHLRGGDVLAVLGREQVALKGGLWYRVNPGGREGWLHAGQVVFFESRETAERAAGQYR